MPLPEGIPPESLEKLRQYWEERLDTFEEAIYPVFYKKGYSKNTALLAYLMDELDDAIIAATALRGGKIPS